RLYQLGEASFPPLRSVDNETLVEAPSLAPAAAPEPAREPEPASSAPPEREPELRRKTVTIVCCEPGAGESADPERLQVLVGRLFVEARAVVERYGGAVERVGEAVQAVFGLPLVHEDDALRALRSAVALATAVPEARFGLATGEVVTGQAERLAVGEAV